MNARWISFVWFALLMLVPASAQDVPTVGTATQLRVYDPSGAQLTVFDVPDYIYYASANANNSRVVLAHSASLSVYDADSGERLSELKLADALSIDTTDAFLATQPVPTSDPDWMLLSIEQTLYRWNIATGTFERQIDGIDRRRWRLSQDGTRVIDSQGIHSSDAFIPYAVPPQNLRNIAWNEATGQIALFEEGRVAIFDDNTGEQIGVFDSDLLGDVYDTILWDDAGESVILSASTSLNAAESRIWRLAVPSMDVLWEASTGDLTTAIAWNPDETYITASVYSEDGIHVINAQTGETKLRLSLPGAAGIFQVFWSANSMFLYGSGTETGGDTVQAAYIVYDLTTGLPELQEGDISDLYTIPSSTGNHLLSYVYNEGRVLFFDLSGDTPSVTRLALGNEIVGATWSPDGTRALVWTGPSLG